MVSPNSHNEGLMEDQSGFCRQRKAHDTHWHRQAASLPRRRPQYQKEGAL